MPSTSRQQLPEKGTKDRFVGHISRGQSAPRNTGDKKGVGKNPWEEVRSPPDTPASRGTSNAKVRPCQRNLDITGKASPLTADPGNSCDISTDEGKDGPAGRRLIIYGEGSLEKQGGDTICRSTTRNPRDKVERDKLPMVKCWEGSTEKWGGGDEEGERGGVVKGRGRAETSPQRTKDFKASSHEGKTRGSVNVSTSSGVGRNGGVAFGRALSDGPRAGQHGKGRARTVRSAFATMDGKDQPGGETSPLSLPLEGDACDYEETLSISSANSVAQELSVSSLPPVGAVATATDMIFEELSFEGSGASASLASSSDRNGVGGGSDVDGEDSGDGGRKEGGPAPRQRRRSLDALARTRCEQDGSIARVKALIYGQLIGNNKT